MDSTDQLKQLYLEAFGQPPDRIEPLGAHASARSIYRIYGAGRIVVGVINSNRVQNRAFVEFTNHFRRHGLPAPEIYKFHSNEECYLEEDLGSKTLLDVHFETRPSEAEISPETLELYLKAAEYLPRFQITAGRTLDYSLCTQSQVYDRRSMLWDMNFFLDSFVRQYGIAFDAAKMESDCETFTQYLSQAGTDYFMYRDFQARNIMVRNGKLHFIDYQEGRRGALQYDITSLVYQSKANLPPEARKAILHRYMDAVAELIPLDRERFLGYYQGFVFIRIMQVLGTYGEQGLKQKKEYFRQSIPLALNNLAHLVETLALPVDAPELLRVFRALSTLQHDPLRDRPAAELAIFLSSFSYRAGMPPVGGDHGGGFVFDCRCIPNPGREDQYKEMTGLDQPVKDYLDAKGESEQFLSHVEAIINQAIGSYTERGFTSLMISFGCTGGQHRSVYFTERLAAILRKRTGLSIEVKHHGLEALARRRAEKLAEKK